MVTRARAQASALAALLARAGARSSTLPVIAIADPADGGAALAARRRARRASTTGWCSPRPTPSTRFVARLRDGETSGRARLAAVGAATAAALAPRTTWWPTWCPRTATAEALVDAMPAAAGRRRAGRVLFPGPPTRRDVLAAGLRAKGWEVDEVEAYRTVAAGPDEGATAGRPRRRRRPPTW